jgi:hypothetical protein
MIEKGDIILKIVESQWIHCKNKAELYELLTECEEENILFNGLYPAKQMLDLFSEDKPVSIVIQANMVGYCDDRDDIGIEWNEL